MCCEPRGLQTPFKSWGYTFGRWCGCGPFFRRFVSAKEERERLEEYRDQLKNELTAIEEHLEEFKDK